MAPGAVLRAARRRVLHAQVGRFGLLTFYPFHTILVDIVRFARRTLAFFVVNYIGT